MPVFAGADYTVSIKEIIPSNIKGRPAVVSYPENDLKHVSIYRKNKNISLKSLGSPVRLNKENSIKTDKYAGAEIIIFDNFNGKKTKIILDSNTLIKINKMPDKIEGIQGNFLVETIKKGVVPRSVTKLFNFFVETKYSITALLGTKVYFSVDKNQKIPDVVVLEGQVEINSKDKSFAPITLYSFERYVNGLINASEKDSMTYKGLGEGTVLYVPAGSYHQGGSGLYSGGSSQGNRMFDGIVYPKISTQYMEDPRITKIHTWLEKLGYE